MKQLSKLKLANISKANMLHEEMRKLYGGNYCNWVSDNHVTNYNEDRCSCGCYNYNDSYSYMTTDAIYYKSNGTVIP